MLRINFYISGHGYGHATRSAQLIAALLSSSPGTHITIITTAPTHLFPSSPRISFMPQVVDSAIIQPQPYNIDAQASFTNLHAFLAESESISWRKKMSDILEETQCNLVIADAPYPIAWAEPAKERGVKSILVSNFTFDAIFAQLLTYLPASSSSKEKDAVEKIQRLYTSYDFVIRLPGFIAFPFIETFWSKDEKSKRLFDAPLIFRKPRSSRKVVLEKLGIPVNFQNNNILLVQFGGQLLDKKDESAIPVLPDGWICLFSSPVDDPKFFTFPLDVHSPDLVAVADVVLGKIGYGTVSECVGMNKILLYVLRPMFAEEPGLLKYMNENGVCEEISVADFEKGNWASTIERAMKAQRLREPADIMEGSAQVAKMIEGLLS